MQQHKPAPSANQAVAGGSIGGALGAILVWLLPQVSTIEIDATEGAWLAVAFGTVFAGLIRYLPKPRA